MSKMKNQKTNEISRTTKPNTKLASRKLFLNREMLRILSVRTLEEVAGGYAPDAAGECETMSRGFTQVTCACTSY